MTYRDRFRSGRAAAPPSLRAIVVAVPVRDEEILLDASLRSLMRAVGHPRLDRLSVRIAVVLDGCADRSGKIALAVAREIRSPGRDHRLTVIETLGGNVGRARHVGLRDALDQLPGPGPETTWLATTDADSRVPPSWLAHQVAQRAQGVGAWAGTVTVDDWTDRPAGLPASFRDHYRLPGPGGHIHGASMGFDASAYLRAGGFPPVPSAEDHGLWRRFGEIGTRRVHDASCPVATSGRRNARAPDGFARALDRLERQFEHEELEDVD